MRNRPTTGNWHRVGVIRRVAIISAIVLTTVVATSHMAAILPHHGLNSLERVVAIVFGVLFAWISVGFWEAMAGVWTIVRGRDRYAITHAAEEKTPQWSSTTRACLIMPIYNEDVARVFARIRSMYESLQRTGMGSFFDIFVLSDTTDPDTWVAEEIAWAELCSSLGVSNRIFYRRRRKNRKRKSGNIADFCRRWGRAYRYMVVLDADSVMTGVSLVKLVSMMETHSDVGIIQTCPMAVNSRSLLARVQQFANQLYSPTFSAGLHFLQLGDSHYWGHNAIIRIEPFMKHCALPTLSGKPPLGGEILSHDFVEAALMRRAGWEVWLAYDLGGSYEELPPTLITELTRDRRWCQGNLQHIRLIFARGLSPAHRVLFMNGIMAYGSALLWFLFLSLSTAEAISEAFRIPDYFPVDHALFPTWPVWHFKWALTLLATTAVLLFVPKLGSLLALIIKGRSQYFGGIVRLILSSLAEIIISTLFAPIRMLFHTKFVAMTLLGWKVGWDPQQRSESGIRWREASRLHWSGMVLAALWAMVLYMYDRSFFWWNVPVFGPLLLSVPLTVWSSRISAGRLFRKAGLLLTPEEVAPVPELSAVEHVSQQTARWESLPDVWRQGFVRAVADPRINELHVAMMNQRRPARPAVRERNEANAEKALHSGPDSLSPKEKSDLLLDAEAVKRLHQRVWKTSVPEYGARWGIPG